MSPTLPTSLEWLCEHACILRVHEPGCKGEVGEPYTWAVTLRVTWPGAVEGRGVTVCPSKEEYRAGEARMAAEGIEWHYDQFASLRRPRKRVSGGRGGRRVEAG